MNNGQRLVRWFEKHQRDLPWREQRSPYRTWVSEIMLQQTTVDTVTPRFLEFMDRFPTVGHLAAATEEEVVGAWSGLGYYRRARSLHAGAQTVMARFGGEIPSKFTELLTLPGVGSYTGGAIASLAFGEAVPAIDGNVARVASRLWCIDEEVTKAAAKKRMGEHLLAMMPKRKAGAFNEALIELGAMVCRPKSPRCELCPLASACQAHASGTPERWPKLKARRQATPIHSLRALVADGPPSKAETRFLVVQRDSKASLLPGFFEFPGRWIPDSGGEPTRDILQEILSEALNPFGLRLKNVKENMGSARHSITHHRIRSEAFLVSVTGEPQVPHAWLSHAELVAHSHLTTETRKLLKTSRGASL